MTDDIKVRVLTDIGPKMAEVPEVVALAVIEKIRELREENERLRKEIERLQAFNADLRWQRDVAMGRRDFRD